MVSFQGTPGLGSFNHIPHMAPVGAEAGPSDLHAGRRSERASESLETDPSLGWIDCPTLAPPELSRKDHDERNMANWELVAGSWGTWAYPQRENPPIISDRSLLGGPSGYFGVIFLHSTQLPQPCAWRLQFSIPYEQQLGPAKCPHPPRAADETEPGSLQPLAVKLLFLLHLELLGSP